MIVSECVLYLMSLLQSVYSEGNIAVNVNLFEWDYTRELKLLQYWAPSLLVAHVVGMTVALQNFSD